LEETQRRRACSLYLESKRKLGISRDQIPQLRGLDVRLKETSNFHIAPIEGLVETRDYTPEPDIVHEIIGHIPNFTNPDFADYSQSIGRGAVIASDEQLAQLGRLYWFTVEFGLVEEGGEIKAFGAGLLSSYSELEHAFGDEVERRKFDLEEVIHMSFDYSDMQPLLFVIPSYAYLKEVTREFIGRFGKHSDREMAPVGAPNAFW
jgi:phenylalanine-4-hydroxylase